VIFLGNFKKGLTQSKRSKRRVAWSDMGPFEFRALLQKGFQSSIMLFFISFTARFDSIVFLLRLI